MSGIRFSVCGCQSENPFVCFDAKTTQRACARDLPWARKDDGRKVPETVGNKETVSRKEQQRPVDRRGESREGHGQQKGAEETSRQNRSVKRWESGREETGQQKSERRLLKPADLLMLSWPTREFKSALLVALWEFSLEYTLALAHRMHKKCHRLPPLALEANPSPRLFVLFFHPLGYILRIFKEMWNIPGWRWEKPLDDSNGHEWFKEAEIVGSAGGYCHIVVCAYTICQYG